MALDPSWTTLGSSPSGMTPAMGPVCTLPGCSCSGMEASRAERSTTPFRRKLEPG